MHLGCRQGVDGVGCGGYVDAVGEGAAYRQCIGDPRLPCSRWLLTTASAPRLRDGGGCAAEDLLNWRGTVEEFTADVREAGEESTWVGLANAARTAGRWCMAMDSSSPTKDVSSTAARMPGLDPIAGRRSPAVWQRLPRSPRWWSRRIPVAPTDLGGGRGLGAGGMDLRLAACVVVTPAVDTHIIDNNAITKR